MSSATAANLIEFKERPTTSAHFDYPVLERLFKSLARKAYERAAVVSPVPHVLDLGAGDGHASLEFLRLGCRVMAVDVSAEQLHLLRDTCGEFSERLATGVYDLNSEAAAIPGEFDIICASSMLHHIPDYLKLIQDVIPLLKSHGQFLCFQDPIRLDSLPLSHRFFSEFAYASARVRQKGGISGIGRKLRRMAGIYNNSVADNCEYHAVRNGVDEEAISRLFEHAEFVHYFCTPSPAMQSLGERLGIVNEFGLICSVPASNSAGR